jgi:predicted lipoprotein with Yx(FWY)xxD motif
VDRRKKVVIAVAGAALSSGLVFLIFGGAGGLYGSSPSTAATARQGDAGVAVATSKLGQILVDGNGRTLYLVEAYTNGSSTCDATCAQAWPPLIAKGPVTADNGAKASELGSTTRQDGAAQITYHGHPLYNFSGGAKAGDTTGQGSHAFGADRYVVAPSGDKIDNG